MPENLAIIHDNIVLWYYQTAKSYLFNKLRLIPIITKSKNIIPVEAILRIVPEISKGIEFVLFLTPNLISL